MAKFSLGKEKDVRSTPGFFHPTIFQGPLRQNDVDIFVLGNKSRSPMVVEDLNDRINAEGVR